MIRRPNQTPNPEISQSIEDSLAGVVNESGIAMNGVLSSIESRVERSNEIKNLVNDALAKWCDLPGIADLETLSLPKTTKIEELFDDGLLNDKLEYLDLCRENVEDVFPDLKLKALLIPNQVILQALRLDGDDKKFPLFKLQYDLLRSYGAPILDSSRHMNRYQKDNSGKIYINPEYPVQRVTAFEYLNERYINDGDWSVALYSEEIVPEMFNPSFTSVQTIDYVDHAYAGDTRLTNFGMIEAIALNLQNGGVPPNQEEVSLSANALEAGHMRYKLRGKELKAVDGGGYFTEWAKKNSRIVII